MPYANAHTDLAATAFLIFVVFFSLLLLHLRREDRREGYPLEEDNGRLQPAGGVLTTAHPKTFILPHGRGTVQAPSGMRDTRPVAGRRSVVPGSPLTPVGDPMASGIGPAAYAQRAALPDLTPHGLPKIVPMRVLAGSEIARGDADPRGMDVLGCDGARAGVVDELWIDRSEVLIRYLSVRLDADGRSVLLPMTMAIIRAARRVVLVDAILAAQFAGVPAIAAADQITADEEERICAYYGGGFLFATHARSEPVL